MKYFSIDVETAGLSASNDTLLQVGIVFEDTENPVPEEQLPKLCIFLDVKRLEGSPYAIKMNEERLEMIEDLKKCRSEFKDDGDLPETMEFDSCVINSAGAFIGTYSASNMLEVLVKKWEDAGQIVEQFARSCLKESGNKVYIVAAGKNYMGFDHKFLTKNGVFPPSVRVSRRTLDPAMLYALPGDKFPPNLQECLDRAGINTSVAHDAVADAIDVIKLLRFKKFAA